MLVQLCCQLNSTVHGLCVYLWTTKCHKYTQHKTRRDKENWVMTLVSKTVEVIDKRQQNTTQPTQITCRHLSTDLLRISSSISKCCYWYSPVCHWTTIKPLICLTLCTSISHVTIQTLKSQLIQIQQSWPTVSLNVQICYWVWYYE